MSISSLVTSIKTRVSTVLGGTYSELGYALDITKNSLKGNEKRYAVLPKSASEVSSIIGFITLDQEFEVIITDNYINTSMSDSKAQDKAITLQDLALNIYNDLIQTKCGSPNTCITVSNFSLSDSQFLEKDSVVVQSMTFKIKYRNQI